MNAYSGSRPDFDYAEPSSFCIALAVCDRTDWTIKESVRAQIRVRAKRILKKDGYPPDKQEKATRTLREQAEALAERGSGAFNFLHQEGKIGATRRELDGWMKTLPQPCTAAMEATTGVPRPLAPLYQANSSSPTIILSSGSPLGYLLKASVKINTLRKGANTKMRTKKGPALFLLTILLAASAALVADDISDRNNQFDFALVGDVPYAPTASLSSSVKVQTYPSPEYNALISDINDHKKVLFTVHMGDIKAGDTWCVGGLPTKDPAGAENIYTKNLELFNTFRNGLIYLLGDNEWTDCHRTNNGAYNPSERLAYIRGAAGFFATNQSLGQQPITLTRQSSDAGYELYKENVMWRVGGILFVGLNQPGSNNNHFRITSASSPLPTDDNETEYTARNAANIQWLRKAFTLASQDASTKAIMIMQQANVFERFLETNAAGVPQYARSGYEAFVAELRNQTIAFGKPVALVGGDTHTVRIDKPLTAVSTVVNGVTTYTRNAQGHIVGFPAHSAATGNGVVTPTTQFNTTSGAAGCAPLSPTCVVSTRVQNFTRVEVFGSPDVAWVRVVVDPFDPNVFSFATQTIPGTGHGRDGRSDDDDQN